MWFVFTLNPKITMKQLLFFIFVLLSVAETKAQHSDLYNYIMSTVKPTHFPEYNTITIRVTGDREGSTIDNQPVLVLNDIVQMPDIWHNITNFASLDTYTMTQLQSVYIWHRSGDIIQNSYGGRKGHRGVIFVYTKDFVFPNPQKPTISRRLRADYNRATRIVVFEATPPVPPISTGNKGKK